MPLGFETGGPEEHGLPEIDNPPSPEFSRRPSPNNHAALNMPKAFPGVNSR